MKIFYAVQATGNGHISRAMELLPYLQQYGQVDVFLSGSNSNLKLDAPVKYRSKGVSLQYTCNGSLSYWKTIKSIRPIEIRKEAKELPVEKYDLVINDYDYITAMACAIKKKPSVNFGHQASFQSMKVPRPVKKNATGELILKHFAKADTYLGLHFKPYDDFITTPVIKKEILDANPGDMGYITVYLPSYCEPQLIQIFSQFKDFTFEVFSRESAQSKTVKNIRFIPVDKSLFNKSLINCSGIITGGGFETPSEAIHLGKKLMSIPIRGQYEQCCNAAALQQMNIMTLDKINDDFKVDFERWVNDYKAIQIDYSKSIPTCMDRLFSSIKN